MMCCEVCRVAYSFSPRPGFVGARFRAKESGPDAANAAGCSQPKSNLRTLMSVAVESGDSMAVAMPLCPVPYGAMCALPAAGQLAQWAPSAVCPTRHQPYLQAYSVLLGPSSVLTPARRSAR